jgi:hypothetical protein
VSKDRVATEATAVSPQINNARRNQLIRFVERHAPSRIVLAGLAMLAYTEADLEDLVRSVVEE